MAKQSSENKIVVYGAITANLVIAVSKFAVALISGSSSMLSEGIHSTADTGNELLLLLGIHRSQKEPDELHPFGYGQELYFWGLIVALILFSVGGGLSLYEGISHIEHPAEMDNPVWNYVVLGVSFIVEFISWIIAFRKLLQERMTGESIWHVIRTSKDPSVYTVLGEDTADLLGIVVAFIGVFLAHWLNNSLYDGVASIVIGVILVLIAVFLARQSKSLIVGESADRQFVRHVCKLVESDHDIKQVRRLLTMQLAPQQILITMEIQFRPNLTTREITTAIHRVEKVIRQNHPEAYQIFIEAGALRMANDA